MDKLLTKDDLAKHFQVTLQTINNYLREGIIQQVKGLPCVRFNPGYIAKFEGIELDKHSPLEFARLERKNKELQQRVSDLENVITQMHILTTKVYLKEEAM